VHSQNGEVLVEIHNYGREMAESISVQLYFSPEFVLTDLKISSQEPTAARGRTFLQTGRADYAEYTTWGVDIPLLHADVFGILTLGNVTMPSGAGRYDVPFRVWEKRLGRTENVLTFDVT
jgi:hypothetical protein